MNAKARALGLRDTHFVRPDGLDAPGHVSSARDVTRLARVAMREPLDPRGRRGCATRRSPAGGTLPHLERPARPLPGRLGVKTGHTDGAGWSQVAAARGARRDGLRDDPRQPDARRSGTPTSPRCSPGALAATASVERDRRRPHVRAAPSRRTAAARRGSSPRGRCGSSFAPGRPLVERVVAPGPVELPVAAGQRLGEVRVYERRPAGRARSLVAAPTRSRARALAGRARLVRRARRSTHLRRAAST